MEGSISVTWSEARDSYHPSLRCFLGDGWQQKSDKVCGVDAKKEGVGALKSSRGSTEVEVPLATTTWIPERELYTATIKYCEEAGLVVRGIIRPQASVASKDEDMERTTSTKRQKRKRQRQPVAPISSSVVDLTQTAAVKREGRPKKEESGGNVIVID